MRKIQAIIFPLFIIIFGCKDLTFANVEKEAKKPEETAATKPKVSFTFDDGTTSNLAGFSFEEWNRMILSHLDRDIQE